MGIIAALRKTFVKVLLLIFFQLVLERELPYQFPSLHGQEWKSKSPIGIGPSGEPLLEAAHDGELMIAVHSEPLTAALPCCLFQRTLSVLIEAITINTDSLQFAKDKRNFLKNHNNLIDVLKARNERELGHVRTRTGGFSSEATPSIPQRALGLPVLISSGVSLHPAPSQQPGIRASSGLPCSPRVQPSCGFDLPLPTLDPTPHDLSAYADITWFYLSVSQFQILLGLGGMSKTIGVL